MNTMLKDGAPYLNLIRVYSDVKEIKVFEMDVTPSIAQYILIHHNKDNRKVTNSQINKIAKSIREDGWLRDGQPLTFNVDGNITEGQHRLNAIVAEDVTVPMIIVLGVELNCFTNTAPAKPRRPEDEIQRKDKSIVKAWITTFNDGKHSTSLAPFTTHKAKS